MTITNKLNDSVTLFAVGDTRVIPQSMELIYQRLMDAAKGLGLA